MHNTKSTFSKVGHLLWLSWLNFKTACSLILTKKWERVHQVMVKGAYAMELHSFFTNNQIDQVSWSWSCYSWLPYFILYICHSSSWLLQLPLQLNMLFQISSGMYLVIKRGQDMRPFVALIPCKKSRGQLRVTFRSPVKLIKLVTFKVTMCFVKCEHVASVVQVMTTENLYKDTAYAWVGTPSLISL